MVSWNSDMSYVDFEFVWHLKIFLHVAYVNILSPGRMCFLVIVVCFLSEDITSSAT